MSDLVRCRYKINEKWLINQGDSFALDELKVRFEQFELQVGFTSLFVHRFVKK